MSSSRNTLKSRRAATAGLALITASALLAGCSFFQGDSGGGGEDSLVFWSMWEKGEPQSEVLQAAIDEFEEAEGIDVTVQWAGREVSTRVQTAANTGDVPDLTDNAVEVLLAGAGADVYRGLDSVYEREIPGEDQSVAEVVPENYIEPYRNADGAPIVVPHSVTTTSIWYDADKLPEVAEAPPATWNEFVAVLSEMKSEGQSPLALDGTIPDYNAYWLAEMTLRQLGSGWLNEAARDETGETFRDPQFLAAAERVQALVDSGYFMEGYQGSKLPAQEQAWAAGDANFIMMGSWAPLGKEEVAREGAVWRTFPAPLADGGVNSVEANLLGFGIPSEAKNPENAEKFIAFFMQRDRLGNISAEANQLTPRADVDPPADLADVAAMLESADSAHRYLDGIPSDLPDWWNGVFLPADDKLVFGDITAAEFVETLVAESANYWKNNG